jgi:ribonucleoside-diphosphate reductase alpha chain
MIDYNRDYNYDYFGIRTLERSYLMKVRKYNRTWRKVTSEDIIIERPSHMFMRVALFIHQNDLNAVKETYDLLMNRYFTHATPTLFNAGTRKPQLSSCYLIAVEDNMDSISETLGDIMKISKWAGGIGVHTSSIRSEGSVIRGTNGISDGVIPLCKGLNWISTYVNQGGKRKGSIAVYKEMWHPDILDFIQLRKNTGIEERRCRDLFLALWISDLFMERVEKDLMWSFMCPDECPGLNLVYGEEFNKLYERYENKKLYVSRISAREIFKELLISQCETGFPYMCYKDNANRKSNQSNLGTIRSSNLCSEIMEYSDEKETAVCNLVSICLPAYIKYDSNNKPYYDYNKLMEVCRISVRNLNKVIDLNYYPTEKTKVSNMRHRPIGIGVQGLSDVYNIMKYPWDSEESYNLNKQIFEHMYYACISESCELAKIYGKYESFDNSPFSRGQLQWHMWGVNRNDLSKDLDWDNLIEDVKTYGTRNSLLTALMPTASTAQIMGNYEGFEPYRKMLFVRTTLAGEFIVFNEYLIKDLKELGLWNDDMRKLIIINDGSIQDISEIPENIKNIYKTAFEIPLKTIIKQSIERAPFIDQSQSLNLFLNKPDFKLLASAHFYGWKGGLKTGMYYLHSNPAVNPINFGIDIDDIKRLKKISSLNDIIGYGLDKTKESREDKRVDTSPGISPEASPNNSTSSSPVMMCKWIPGRKVEGCEMCSS